MQAPITDLSFTLRSDSPLPLYYQLEQALRFMIASGSWSPGSLICSERELMQAAGVSRATVRQAIGNLMREGLLERVHGRGTFGSTQARAGDALRLQLCRADGRARPAAGGPALATAPRAGVHGAGRVAGGRAGVAAHPSQARALPGKHAPHARQQLCPLPPLSGVADRAVREPSVPAACRAVRSATSPLRRCPRTMLADEAQAHLLQIDPGAPSCSSSA